MFSSLRTRLWLTYALVIGVALSIVVFALGLYVIRNPSTTREELHRLKILALVPFQRSEEIQNLSLDQLQLAVEKADQTLDVRVLIANNGGTIIVDSRSTVETSLIGTKIVNDARQRSYRYRDPNGTLWLAQQRELPGGYNLILAARNPTETLWNILRNELIRPLFGAGLLALLLSLLLGFWIARWIATPLQRMAQAAHEVSEGRYQIIPVKGPREVQDLNRAFNNMIIRVQTSRQSQRDFVANVSHELKTPLTSIKGFAQAILDGTADSPENLHQAAEIINSEASRMYRLVTDLLDLARMDAGVFNFERTQVDISSLLSAVIENFSPFAQESQVTLIADIDPDMKITGDGDRLSQVFTNLVDNGLKFSKENGKVFIHAHFVGEILVITIEDDGEGIPKDELERVFERFYQVDKSRQGGERHGSGLGLAIAKEIVLAHHGEILVQNNPSQGTTFIVKIPVVHPDIIKSKNN